MEKEKLEVGRRCIRRRRVVIDDIPREAECFLRCEEVNEKGARFSRDFEPSIIMTNMEIEKELRETI